MVKLVTEIKSTSTLLVCVLCSTFSVAFSDPIQALGVCGKEVSSLQISAVWEL